MKLINLWSQHPLSQRKNCNKTTYAGGDRINLRVTMYPQGTQVCNSGYGHHSHQYDTVCSDNIMADQV